MKHRIFIAVNLPEDVKKKIVGYEDKWPELPVRWTKKENLHITLMFLGYLAEEELLQVVNVTKEVASRHASFSINLKRIIYGPPKKTPPRMVWVEGEKSKELGSLQGDLENSLLTPMIKNSGNENRPYAPHITLGRIKTWEFRKLEIEERPQINEEINLNFNVNSIEVMESQLKRGGPEYTVLEAWPLKT
ncbi:MAG: RNA 2',3'-cyclic phosphodiesterase [Candidatus Pacebacteria bacterium]|nr:RNA 2',3'-cyclic phosphodiesterase [Candidatus Paceibacterota bacterium]